MLSARGGASKLRRDRNKNFDLLLRRSSDSDWAARRKRSRFSNFPSLQSTRWRAAAYASTQSESELRRSRRSKFLFRSRLNFDAPPRPESMPRHRSFSRIAFLLLTYFLLTVFVDVGRVQQLFVCCWAGYGC